MSQQVSDVVIVGAGIAGLVMAFECLQQGKTVHVVERGSRHDVGGLSQQAFGGMALIDTPLQRRSRIQDSPDIALADWESFAEFGALDVWPRRWARYYVNESTERVYHYLVDKGLSFLPAVNWVERGSVRRGNSVPRYHILWGTGQGLVARFVELLQQHRNNHLLRWSFDSRVEELLVTNGRVHGCRAVSEDNGASHEFSAQRVVVATGGTNGCLKNVREHWPDSWGEPPAEMLNGSHPFADGLLHAGVERHGAVITHLDKMWNYAAGIPHPKPKFADHGLSLIPCKSALWLDHRGCRIGPEPLVTGFDTRELCRKVSRLEKPWTWQLLNWRIAAKEFAISGAEHNPYLRDHRLFSFLREVLLGNHRLVRQMAGESDHFVVSDSIEGLVEKMNGLNPDDPVSVENVRAAVSDYDSIVRRGRSMWNDDQLRKIEHARAWRSDRFRTCKPKPILDRKSAPLIAIKLRLITRKSLGGIQTDLHSRVLTSAGSPLPGLYAIGEAAGFGGGGASGKRSLEGTFLSGCILTARAAADAIGAD